MKIALCSIGSQGDLQPFITLGKALLKRDHEVVVSSAEMYREQVEAAGIECVNFKGDYEKITDSEAFKKSLGGNPLKLKNKLKTEVFPIIENSLDTFYEVSKWADIVVYHPKTLIDCFGYKFPEKLIKAYVVPIFTPTSFFPSPAFSGIPVNSLFNKMSYKITNLLMKSVKQPIKNFCRKHDFRYPMEWVGSPMIYGISPAFLPRPTDYPENHLYTGFWLEDSETELSKELEGFLKTPKKKLVITFGSMPYKSDIDIHDFLHHILRFHDIHIVVIKGWGLKNKSIDAGPQVMAVDTAPYDKLFPEVDAVVHHGGAGTTALALQAGIPSLVCPVLHPFGDQLFWGKQLYKQKLGVKPIPLKQLKPKHLTIAVGQLLNTDWSATTARISQRIRDENGLDKAVKFIEEYKLQKNVWR